MVKEDWLALTEFALGFIAIGTLALALKYWYQHPDLTQMQWLMKQWPYLLTGVITFAGAIAIGFNRE